MTNETDTFVHEVDERLREERMLAIAKRYGPWLIGAFVLLLASLGGWQAWQAYRVQSAQEQADQYAAAQALAAEGNFADAKSAFEELSGEGPRSYRVMAQMARAAILAEEGDLAAALAGFDAAAEAAGDPVMRETAQLRAAFIAAETEDFTAVRQRLEPLAQSESRIAFLAREVLAVEAWEAGELDLARETLETLTLAFDAPESVRQRAQVALSVIGPAPAEAESEAETPAPSEGESK